MLRATPCPNLLSAARRWLHHCSMRARIVIFEKPGSRSGDRINPFSKVTTRSGSMALSVPFKEPVSVSAPSVAMLTSLGGS